MKIAHYSLRKALASLQGITIWSSKEVVRQLQKQFALASEDAETLAMAVLECEPSLIPDKWITFNPGQAHKVKILSNYSDGIHPHFVNVYKRRVKLPNEDT